ncbi:MAG TPA: VOC family protein [Acidobacteriaceae bacterium]|nr:VOC family protein [Acidobacteriaceae bacterium]
MMTVKAVSEGYHSLQPYLHVRGAAQAIQFCQRAFGATEIMRFPQPDGKIGHAELRIGDSVIMLADEAPERGIRSPADLGGSAVSLMFCTEDCDAVYRRAIAAGAKSLREPADQFYGDRSAGVEDPFGFQWWFATHIRDMSVEEMKRAATEQKTA